MPSLITDEISLMVIALGAEAEHKVLDIQRAGDLKVLESESLILSEISFEVERRQVYYWVGFVNPVS